MFAVSSCRTATCRWITPVAVLFATLAMLATLPWGSAFAAECSQTVSEECDPTYKILSVTSPVHGKIRVRPDDDCQCSAWSNCTGLDCGSGFGGACWEIDWNDAYTTHLYPPNAALTIEAISDTGYVFTAWQGTAGGSLTNLTMNTSKSISATFVEAQMVELTYVLSDPNAGSLSFSTNPTELLVSNTGNVATFYAGTSVEVTASPGSSFLGFAGDLTGAANEQTINMSADKSITAYFSSTTAQLQIEVLSSIALATVATSAQDACGHVIHPLSSTVSGNILTEIYPVGTEVDVTLDPGTHKWNGWSGDLTGMSLAPTITLTGNKAVTANIEEGICITVLHQNGSVTCDPAPYNSVAGTDTIDLYFTKNPSPLVTVALTPEGDAGYGFLEWFEDASGNNIPLQVSRTNGAYIEAIFRPLRTLTVTTVGNGTVAVSPPARPDGTHVEGTNITLTATPAEGHGLYAWSGGVTGSVNPKSFVLAGNASVQAEFRALYDFALDVTCEGTVKKTGAATYLAMGDSFTDGALSPWVNGSTGWSVVNSEATNVASTGVWQTCYLPQENMDYECSFKYRRSNDTGDKRLLLNIRYKDSTNYVRLVFNATSIALDRVVAGTFQSLTSNANEPTETGQDYYVRYVCDGPTITVYRGAWPDTMTEVLQFVETGVTATDRVGWSVPPGGAKFHVDDFNLASRQRQFNGTTLNLTATPFGSSNVTWEGDLTGTGTSASMPIDGAKAIRATMGSARTVTATVQGEGILSDAHGNVLAASCLFDSEANVQWQLSNMSTQNGALAPVVSTQTASASIQTKANQAGLSFSYILESASSQFSVDLRNAGDHRKLVLVITASEIRLVRQESTGTTVVSSTSEESAPQTKYFIDVLAVENAVAVQRGTDPAALSGILLAADSAHTYVTDRLCFNIPANAVAYLDDIQYSATHPTPQSIWLIVTPAEGWAVYEWTDVTSTATQIDQSATSTAFPYEVNLTPTTNTAINVELGRILTFPDANLAQLVADSIGTSPNPPAAPLPYTDDILQQHVQDLTTLDYNLPAYDVITGVPLNEGGLLPNPVDQIRDLSGISQLPALEFLRLKFHDVQDMNAPDLFAGLSSLHTVELSGNPGITGVTALAHPDLTALSSLQFSSCPLVDVTAIQGKQSVTFLSLYYANVNATNLNTIALLPNLTGVNIGRNGLVESQLSCLSNLQHLRNVGAINNQLQGLQPLVDNPYYVSDATTATLVLNGNPLNGFHTCEQIATLTDPAGRNVVVSTDVGFACHEIAAAVTDYAGNSLESTATIVRSSFVDGQWVEIPLTHVRDGEAVRLVASAPGYDLAHWETAQGEYIDNATVLDVLADESQYVVAIMVPTGQKLVSTWIKDARGTVAFDPAPLEILPQQVISDSAGVMWTRNQALYPADTWISATVTPGATYDHYEWTTKSRVQLETTTTLSTYLHGRNSFHFYTTPGETLGDYSTGLSLEISGCGTIIESGVTLNYFDGRLSDSVHPNGVELLAEPDPDWVFADWRDTANNLLSSVSRIDTDLCLFYLDVDGSGTIDVADLDLVAEVYLGGDISPLVADVNQDGSISEDDQYAIHYSLDAHALQALFDPAYTYQISTSSLPANSGTVVVHGEPGPGAIIYVGAQPAEGFVFSHWEGDIVENTTADMAWLEMDGNKSVTAVFVVDQSPVITLLGEDPLIFAPEEHYLDPWVVAIDAEGNNISSWIDARIYDAGDGWLAVSYDVTDAEGREAETVYRSVYLPQSLDLKSDPSYSTRDEACEVCPEVASTCFVKTKVASNGEVYWTCARLDDEGAELCEDCTSAPGQDGISDPPEIQPLDQCDGERVVRVTTIGNAAEKAKVVLISKNPLQGGWNILKGPANDITYKFPTNYNTAATPYAGAYTAYTLLVNWEGFVKLCPGESSDLGEGSSASLPKPPTGEDSYDVHKIRVSYSSRNPITIGAQFNWLEPDYTPPPPPAECSSRGSVQVVGCGTVNHEVTRFLGTCQHILTAISDNDFLGWDLNGDGSIDSENDSRYVLASNPDFSGITAIFGECHNATTADHPDLEPANKADCGCEPVSDCVTENVIEEEDIDPVYLFSGEFYHDVEDLRVPGVGMDFVWARKYRSRIGITSAFGDNWDFSYNIFIQKESNGDLLLYSGQDRVDRFTYDSANQLWKRGEYFATILPYGPQGYRVIWPNKQTYFFSHLVGDIAPVTSIQDRYGNAILFTYNPSAPTQLVGMTDTVGRDIRIDYEPVGLGGREQISSVSVYDTDGVTLLKQVAYEYHNGGTDKGRLGDLASVTDPLGVYWYQFAYSFGSDEPWLTMGIENYTYDTSTGNDALHNLLTIAHIPALIIKTLPSPAPTPYLINDYDESDRVTTQTWGEEGALINLHYVTDVLGDSTAPTGATKKTIVNDRVGNVTELYYDAGNRPLSRRVYKDRAPNADVPTTSNSNRPSVEVGEHDDASVPYYETTYTWNADSRLSAISYPDGVQREFVYEATADRLRKGNISAVKTWPSDGGAPITYTYTYGSDNRISSVTDGRGYTTDYTYEAVSSGTRLTMERPVAGAVEEIYFDEHGRPTRHVHPEIVTEEVEGNPISYAREDVFTYDLSNGMLDTATLDAGDKNLTTDYDTDALGRVVHVTNALDNGTTYAYDARGRLSSVTSDQAVPRLTFEVEESNAMDVNQDGRISTEDLDLVRHIALGDGVFNSTVVSNADINEDGTVDSADTQLVADYYADVRSSGDGWIPKTVISYFMDNTVAAILTYDDPHSSQPLRRVSYYYDILANPTRVYINNERTSILDYDEAGNCVSVLLAEQPADIEELDSEGNPVTITPGVVPASASRASYAYDTRGNLFEEVRGTEPDDVRTAYAYTPGGKIWKVKVGPEGLERTTTFAYDAFSRIASITDAAETVYSSTFDACGNITRKTTTGVADANGAVAVLRDVKCENYDPMNRVKDINVLSRDPLTGVETWSSSSIDYNAASLPTSISLPLENAIGIACDTMYRTKRRSDSEGNKTEFGYDASSNTQTIVQTQVSEVDASVETYTTSYAWDCLNRLILKDENGGERVQLFSHDALDNLVRYEDASCSVAGQLGRATDCAYNGRGQLEELRPDNTQFIGNTYIEPRPITFRYDTSGRRSGVVDGQGNETTFEYNGYDALEKVTAADGTILRNIEYNDFGDVYRITDANETVVTNTFDAVGRITGRTIAAGAGVETVGQEVFEYDGLSRIVSASTGGNVAELRYDTLGALIYDSVNNAPLSALTDVMGNITDLYYPSSGRSVNFQYDSLGRMDLVTDSALGQVAQYFHVGPSRIKKKLLGGIAAGTETSYNYDTNWLPEFIEQRQRPSNALIDYRQFEYEKMANLAKRANLIGVGNESGKTHDYTYDSFYRLQTSSVDGQLQTEYALDLTGNRRTVTTYPGPTAEEYVLDGTLGAAPDFETVRNQYAATPFDEGRQYDAMGNLRVIEHVAGDETFTYDFQNRLITYAASDGIVTRYTYDGFGRRIRKEVGYGGASPTITQYIYFGWQLIEERDGQGLRIANYLYGLGTTPIAIERDTNGDGSFETYLVQTGRLGNVVALTDAAGNIVERYDYDDFGKPVFLSPNWQVIPQSLYDNSILFNGQYYDEESGLYYYRLRYYEPPTGRFITHDPLGIWGDFNNLGNPYAYVGNNPWSFVDPFGLKGEVDPIFFEAEHPIMRFADADNNDPIRVAGQVLSAAAEGSDLAQEIVALSDLLGCVMADSDSRHAALDAAGLVGDSAGGLGFLFDGANAIAYGKEGDLWNAGISLAAMVPVVGDLGKGLRYTDDVADIAKAAKLKELTRDNFRENLIRYTGNSPYPDMHAHHVFPHEFRDKFWSAGIDVNDPRFGAWWDAGAHLNNHKKYNDEWREFLRQNPTRDQVIERGRDLADELGFSVVF